MPSTVKVNVESQLPISVFQLCSEVLLVILIDGTIEAYEILLDLLVELLQHGLHSVRICGNVFAGQLVVPF